MTRAAIIDRHGDYGSPEYKAWGNMISRCENVNRRGWKNYGGRGIRVCDRWRSSYRNFLADMGRRPSAKHSLDRINVDGDYEPGNCRWADRYTQASNTRTVQPIEACGESRSMSSWARRLGTSWSVISRRLSRGWSPDDAVSVRPGPRLMEPHFITSDGETHSVSGWARRLGVPRSLLRSRIRYGSSPAEAVAELQRRGVSR
jgi:hypothetical protein